VESIFLKISFRGILEQKILQQISLNVEKLFCIDFWGFTALKSNIDETSMNGVYLQLSMIILQ